MMGCDTIRCDALKDDNENCDFERTKKIKHTQIKC